MWIAGLQALQKPLLHLHTQFGRDLPWSTIDMDFMNLNQSAHGDREFAFIAARLRHPRKTVVGHWQDPAVQRRIGAWARAAVGVHEGRHLKVCRFGDNMRHVADTDGDKTEVQATSRRLRATRTPSTTSCGSSASVADAEVERLCVEYDEAVRGRAGAAARAASVARPCARRPASSWACAPSSATAASAPSPTPSRTSVACASCRASAAQRLMADGYGFGGEGDWKSSALVRLVKVMADGLPGGTSFMEDYTYDFGSPGQTLGAHMLEICPTHRGRDGRVPRSTRSSWAGARTPCVSSSRARPGPALIVGLVDMGNRLRLLVNEVDAVEPPEDLPQLPVARAVWEPRPDLATAAEAWLTAGGPHHTAYSLAVDLEVMRDFATMVGVELLGHRRRHGCLALPAGGAVGPGLLAPGRRRLTIAGPSAGAADIGVTARLG